MALFGFMGRNKSVSCVRCNTSVKESEAKMFLGRYYCPSCYEKTQSSGKRGQQTASGTASSRKQLIQEIENAIRAVNMKCTTMHVGDQWEVILGISGKANSYQIKFITKEGGKNDVAMRVFQLTHYPEQRWQDAYRVLNRLQEKYRFLKFTLDKDGDVNLEYDFPACTESVGKSAVEMVIRTMKIVDEVYPDIMRSVWGQPQNSANVGRSRNDRGCLMCGNEKETETRFCKKCFSKVLKRVRSMRYLMGGIPVSELMDVDKYHADVTEPENDCCPYCGTRDTYGGNVCDRCKTRYMDKIMQRAVESKDHPAMLRVRLELFRHIKSDFTELKLADVTVGPTPAGGAYAVRQEAGEDIFITEYDENYKEINHTYGRRGNSRAKEKTVELPAEQIQKLQDAINKNYPGLTAYVRDVNLPEHLAAKYKPDMIIRERAYVDATARVGGMVTTHRYVIMSNHMADLGLFEHGTNWQLHVAQRDSHFKVLGSHTCRGKTAIFLMHLPDDDTWKLFQNVNCNLDKDLLRGCIERFEAKCTLPPIPELAGKEWLARCEFPVGMDPQGNFWDLE